MPPPIHPFRFDFMFICVRPMSHSILKVRVFPEGRVGLLSVG